MSVPSFIRIERGTEGAQDLKLNKGLIVLMNSVHINFLMSADPNLALVPASRYDCHIY